MIACCGHAATSHVKLEDRLMCADCSPLESRDHDPFIVQRQRLKDLKAIQMMQRNNVLEEWRADMAELWEVRKHD